MSFENQTLSAGGFLFKIVSIVGAAFLAMAVVYYFGFTPKVKAQTPQESLKALNAHTGQLLAQAEPPPMRPEMAGSNPAQNPNQMQKPMPGAPQPAAPQPVAPQPNVNTMPQQQVQPMAPGGAPSLGSDIGLGERDPFRPPKYLVDLEYEKSKPPPPPPKPVEPDVIDAKMEAIRRWPLDQYKLIAIIWDVKNPKAMILDQARTMHLLKKNYRIGNRDGVITSITEGEIVVTERGVPITIKIQSNDKKRQ